MLLKTNFNQTPWFIVDAVKKKTTHIAIISHLLSQLKYHHKDDKLLLHKDGLIYPVTVKNIKDKLYK